jgi:glucokinase
VAVGTGIGAGVFVDGRLYRGAHNAAGETGYMYVHGMEQIGPDGLGALERRASGPGIAMAATRILAGNDPAVSPLARHGGEITSDEVWAAAAAGDPLASRVISDTLDTLSLAVANMAFVLDPELIVLGGGVSLAGDALLAPVRERLSKLLTPPITPRVELSRLGAAAQLYGAVFVALDHIDNTIAAEREA